jgi:hypothetical protein
MAKERKYPIAYRPRTCLVNVTVKYWPKSVDSNLRSGEKKLVDHAMKEVVTIKCEKIRITLDYNDEPPTEKLMKTAITRIWEKHRIKADIDTHEVVFRNIDVISSSRVTYDFDEFIH